MNNSSDPLVTRNTAPLQQPDGPGGAHHYHQGQIALVKKLIRCNRMIRPEAPPTLETERLLLRPHTLADVEPSYRMNLDSEVSRFTQDGGVVDRAEIERRIRENVLGDYAKYGFGRLAVVLKGPTPSSASPA